MSSLCFRPGRGVHRYVRPGYGLALPLLTMLLVGCPAAGSDSGAATDAGAAIDSGAASDSGAAIDSGAASDSAISSPCTNLRSDPATGVGVTAVCGFGGTDAYAIQVSREGIPAELISIPLRNMHTPVETVSIKDVERAGRLLAAFIARLDGDFLDSLVWDLGLDDE